LLNAPSTGSSQAGDPGIHEMRIAAHHYAIYKTRESAERRR
jgi:hypothetical protein